MPVIIRLDRERNTYITVRTGVGDILTKIWNGDATQRSRKNQSGILETAARDMRAWTKIDSGQ